MKSWIQIMVLVHGMQLVLNAQEQSEARKVWLSERRLMIERAQTISDEKAIVDLSRIVRGIGSNLTNASEEANQLYSEASRLLQAIPGFAQYFANEIERERSLIEDLPPNDVRWERYDDIRYDYLFNILPQLQSPQTIRVLGEYRLRRT